MKVRTVALWAALGIVVSSAGAMAIPMPGASGVGKSSGSSVRPDPNGSGNDSREVHEPYHFSAGQTLTVDGRLGHASLAKGTAGETFLLASVAGSEETSAASSPLNLAIVIDRSGSMKGARIANALTAAVGMVERMRDGDSVTVVAFDTESQIVMPPTRVSSSTRSSVESSIRSIRLGGDTCISCGLETAMSLLNQTTLGGDRVNRMILLSDGATNHGIRDIPGLRAMAARMRDRGCSISTIGVDVDFDEKVMAAIAAESNGRHYFVADPSGLASIFAQEFDSLLASVARDAELSVELAPGVEVEQVFDRTFRREGSKVVVPFGTFSSKQEKTVLMKLRVPADREGLQAVADVKLAYRDLVQKTEGACSGTLALDITSESRAQRDLDPFVAARVERSRTAQTLTEANVLFEQGRVAEARDKLRSQEQTLAKSEVSARAVAAATPAPAKPRLSRSVDDDFGQQRAAVAQAEANFAPPPPSPADGLSGLRGGGAQPGSPASAGPQQDSREGKAARKTNQSNASDLRL